MKKNYNEFQVKEEYKKKKYVEDALLLEGIIKDNNPEEYALKKIEYEKLFDKSESNIINKDIKLIKAYEYNAVATSHNDIPLKKDNDCLNIGNDISAFAKLIAYKDLSTPLSIGLFGKWGSGKSFFMEKLESKIDSFSKNKDTDIFSKNIVHVKFNAWHYSDTNLWASMVYKIFDRIDNAISEDKSHKIYEELEFSKKELKKKEEQLHKLEERIEEQKNRPVLFSNIEDNVLINQLSKESKTIKEVKEVYENTKGFISLIKEGWRLLFKDKKILIFLLLIPIFLIFGFFCLIFKESIESIISGLSGISGLIYFYYKKALSCLKPLKTVLDKYDEEKNRYIKEKESIDEEIIDIKNGKYFKDFIRSKISTSDYRKHLGLISVIREDFEALERFLCNNEKGIDYGVERIVLYIDDLDRCSDELVVEVLEAVHLLLTFKLFVVVVGIDPRWIKGSLENKFNSLSNSDIKITPKNYIEKIFQIPFKIDAMNDSGKKNLIEDLLTLKKKKEVSHTIENKGSVFAANNTLFAANGTIFAMPNDEYKEYKEIKLEEDEIKYLTKIGKFIDDTPRTIKRFVNTYRLLRSHYDVMDILNEDFNNYKNVALLLGEIFYLETLKKEGFIEVLEKEFKEDYKREFRDKEKLKNLISRFKFDI